MFAALENSNPEVITALINAGPDVHATTKHDTTALEAATLNKTAAKDQIIAILVGTAPSVVNAKKFGDGKYLVGKDLPAGLYRVILKDSIMKMGYVERAKSVTMGFEDILANILLLGDGYVERSKSVAMDMQDIIANEIVQGQGYVEIKKTDFAVRVQGARLIYQD